jgi:hypothetical protein
VRDRFDRSAVIKSSLKLAQNEQKHDKSKLEASKVLLSELEKTIIDPGGETLPSRTFEGSTERP